MGLPLILGSTRTNGLGLPTRKIQKMKTEPLVVVYIPAKGLYRPLGHGAQSLELAGEKVPATQALTIAVALHALPGGHKSAIASSALAHTWPAGHARALMLPGLHNCPTSQLPTGAERPVALQKKPPGHGSASDMPDCGQIVPRRQATAEEVPAGQKLKRGQVTICPALSQKDPGGQTRENELEAAGQNVDTGQAAVGAERPVVAQYDPAGQSCAAWLPGGHKKPITQGLAVAKIVPTPQKYPAGH
jgi:hypothetical protein